MNVEMCCLLCGARLWSVLSAVAHLKQCFRAGKAAKCKDVSDAEMAAGSQGRLASCTARKALCGTMAQVTKACPKTCGTCGGADPCMAMSMVVCACKAIMCCSESMRTDLWVLVEQLHAAM